MPKNNKNKRAHFDIIRGLGNMIIDNGVLATSRNNNNESTVQIKS
jgi:hypothetical protein